MYISDKCEWTPYGYDFSLDEKLDSCHNEDEIINFFKQNKNYGLDMVFNYVKSHYNYRLMLVKQYIAEQGYGLDIFINDEDPLIRKAVARQGYGLDILINDEYLIVRTEVAKHGYGLDKLINDEAFEVRVSSHVYIVNNFNTSLVKWYNENPDKRYYDSLRQIFDDQSCSICCIDLLINDNYFLDYILKNTDADIRSKVRQHLIELRCNNITDWMTNYPNNVYYYI